MTEPIVTELAEAAAAGTRELDRVCDRIARELLADGTEPPFEVRSADFAGDALLICADRYWYWRFLDRPSVSTAAACARWLHAHVAGDARTEVAEKWALGYAFVTKDSVESGTEIEAATGAVMDGDHGSADIAYFAALYHAGKLRANFGFDELDRFLDASLLALAAGEHREDPLFVALRAFSAFGRTAITSRHAVALFERAWHDPRRTRHVVDVCLNGLWVARPFDGQGELLRDRALEAVRCHPGDHVFHYRLAVGHRMCENHDAALDDIDEALALLPAIGRRGSHKQLQEQYLAERNTIRDERRRAEWMAEQRELVDRLVADNAALRRTVQSTPVRTIEVVALFTAAIAFAVGSLQVTLTGALPLRDRAVLLGLFGAGLLLFALLVVGATWFITQVRQGTDPAVGGSAPPEVGR
ncbi:hypothetical protein SAMN05421810_11157 [Amycolatopsis arida]|uniref:Tetratricopeptide repeat-containing protein n=1 Tax=Amycolatopsis arida TaxID=587909 RepID=A0A1I6A3Q2_9PSEU|nr:hypothetical protein [Amycolatopsis arida]TDX88634.1 hypothetical protein CLV69_111156 [Amycolatopsis arida]SFQ63366.1 hypothetical protein SAMN05421810_11157 [Amycolatopsis arida]